MEAKEGLALKGEPSLLERVIQTEKSEKLATIMALDMILVGIDTVSASSYLDGSLTAHTFFLHIPDLYGCLLHLVPSSYTPLRTR